MNVLQIIISAIGIIGFTGGVVGYYGKTRGDSIIAYQARENELLKGTNTRLEKEGVAKDARIKSLEEQNQTLKELAQGSPELKKLAAEIRKLQEKKS